VNRDHKLLFESRPGWLKEVGGKGQSSFKKPATRLWRSICPLIRLKGKLPLISAQGRDTEAWFAFFFRAYCMPWMSRSQAAHGSRIFYPEGARRRMGIQADARLYPWKTPPLIFVYSSGVPSLSGYGSSIARSIEY